MEKHILSDIQDTKPLEFRCQKVHFGTSKRSEIGLKLCASIFQEKKKFSLETVHYIGFISKFI